MDPAPCCSRMETISDHHVRAWPISAFGYLEFARSKSLDELRGSARLSPEIFVFRLCGNVALQLFKRNRMCAGFGRKGQPVGQSAVSHCRCRQSGVERPIDFLDVFERHGILVLNTALDPGTVYGMGEGEDAAVSVVADALPVVPLTLTRILVEFFKGYVGDFAPRRSGLR